METFSIQASNTFNKAWAPPTCQMPFQVLGRQRIPASWDWHSPGGERDYKQNVQVNGLADGAVEESTQERGGGRGGGRTCAQDRRSLRGETVRTRGADCRWERPSWGGTAQARKEPGGALWAGWEHSRQRSQGGCQSPSPLTEFDSASRVPFLTSPWPRALSLACLGQS